MIFSKDFKNVVINYYFQRYLYDYFSDVHFKKYKYKSKYYALIRSPFVNKKSKQKIYFYKYTAEKKINFFDFYSNNNLRQEFIMGISYKIKIF
uniref:Ribosomal protein S10 n=1 Tax=Acavomonas peruviana TaxID=1542312 RepID=V5KVH3_9ALVE|nr:ribosomal protein S10 [Acavomonas peruviana]